jgi:hypothetical protein
MIRDVALMANAEGGLIIYGVVERSGDYPDYIDDGVDRKTVSAEQIDQIILSNINPRVEAPGAAVRHDLAALRCGTAARRSRGLHILVTILIVD